MFGTDWTYLAHRDDGEHVHMTLLIPHLAIKTKSPTRS